MFTDLKNRLNGYWAAATAEGKSQGCPFATGMVISVIYEYFSECVLSPIQDPLVISISSFHGPAVGWATQHRMKSFGKEHCLNGSPGRWLC